MSVVFVVVCASLLLLGEVSAAQVRRHTNSGGHANEMDHHCEIKCMKKLVLSYSCGDQQMPVDEECLTCIDHFKQRRDTMCSKDALKYADFPAKAQYSCGKYGIFDSSSKKCIVCSKDSALCRNRISIPPKPRGHILQSAEDGFLVQGQSLTLLGPKYHNYANEENTVCQAYDCMAKVVSELRVQKDACIVSMNVLQQWSPDSTSDQHNNDITNSEEEEEESREESELREEVEEESERRPGGVSSPTGATVCRELYHVEACNNVVGAECIRSPNDASRGRCSCHPISWTFDQERSMPLDRLQVGLNDPPSNREDAIVDAIPTMRKIEEAENLGIDMNDVALKAAESSGDAKRVEKEMIRLTNAASAELHRKEKERFMNAKKFYDSPEGKMRRRRQAHESCVVALTTGKLEAIASAFRKYVDISNIKQIKKELDARQVCNILERAAPSRFVASSNVDFAGGDAWSGNRNHNAGKQWDTSKPPSNPV